jgi:hypothetical protein
MLIKNGGSFLFIFFLLITNLYSDEVDYGLDDKIDRYKDGSFVDTLGITNKKYILEYIKSDDYEKNFMLELYSKKIIKELNKNGFNIGKKPVHISEPDLETITGTNTILFRIITEPYENLKEDYSVKNDEYIIDKNKKDLHINEYIKTVLDITIYSKKSESSVNNISKYKYVIDTNNFTFNETTSNNEEDIDYSNSNHISNKDISEYDALDISVKNIINDIENNIKPNGYIISKYKNENEYIVNFGRNIGYKNGDKIEIRQNFYYDSGISDTDYKNINTICYGDILEIVSIDRAIVKTISCLYNPKLNDMVYKVF